MLQSRRAAFKPPAWTAHGSSAVSSALAVNMERKQMKNEKKAHLQDGQLLGVWPKRGGGIREDVGSPEKHDRKISESRNPLLLQYIIMKAEPKNYNLRINQSLSVLVRACEPMNMPWPVFSP